jgi:hypothetical protein
MPQPLPAVAPRAPVGLRAALSTSDECGIQTLWPGGGSVWGQLLGRGSPRDQQQLLQAGRTPGVWRALASGAEVGSTQH